MPPHSPSPTLVGSITAAFAAPFRAATLPEEQLSSATGKLVGRSLEKELGSRNPWSVGLGVEHWESAPPPPPALSEGGEGESPGLRPPLPTP